MSYLLLEGAQLHQYKSTEQSLSQPQPINQINITKYQRINKDLVILKN